MKTIVVTSGGFDPLHSGHIAFFDAAKELGDCVVVALNSDAYLNKKKGRAFMPWQERAAVIRALGSVDDVIEFDDSDEHNTSIDGLRKVRERYPDAKIIFAKGGDRGAGNVPEIEFADENFECIFGIGGTDKKNSSSGILQEWKAPKTERKWGHYRVLHENDSEVKVKELIVAPGEQLSMQRHKERAEHWFVVDGVATVQTLNDAGEECLLGVYAKFQHIHIDRTQWHRLGNDTDVPLKVIEIQYGTACVEEDIERLP